MLIMSEEEAAEAAFCHDSSFPFTCAVSDSNVVLEYMKLMDAVNRETSVLFSEGDHTTLIKELGRHKAFYTENNIWALPFKYESLLPLRLDSRVMLYQGNGPTGYSLHDSYAVKGGVPITTRLLDWEPGRDKAAEDSKLLLQVLGKRTNLNGAVIRFSWFKNPPFVWYVKKGLIANGVGFYVDILAELQAKLNFTLEYVPTSGPKEKWGAKMKNGTWNGMVGMLARDQIDLSAIGCSQTKMRGEETDFVSPIRRNLMTLMTATTNKPKLNVFVYLDVLSVNAWIIFIVSIVVASFLFAFMNKDSVPQSFALMTRLFLQIGYEVTMRRRDDI